MVHMGLFLYVLVFIGKGAYWDAVFIVLVVDALFQTLFNNEKIMVYEELSILFVMFLLNKWSLSL